MIIWTQYLSGSSAQMVTLVTWHPGTHDTGDHAITWHWHCWHLVQRKNRISLHNYTQYVQIISLSWHYITMDYQSHITGHTTDVIIPNVLKQQLFLFFFLFQLSNSIHKIRQQQSQVLLNFKTKIFCNSVDNYGLPILFNLYKIWNLLISVKLCRQRNTFVCCIPSYCWILKPSSAVVCHFKPKDSHHLDKFNISKEWQLAA